MSEQQPAICRIVVFTAYRGHLDVEVDEYPAIITKVHEDGVVDLATFGPQSLYFQLGVPFNEDGEAKTWRWPPRAPTK